MDHLHVELQRHVEFKRRLLEDYPDIDDVTLADTLEGATTFNEALAAAVRQMRQDEASIETCKGLATQLAERMGRLRMRADRTKAIVLQAMQDADMAKLPAADFCLSIRATQAAVIVTDPTLIPEDYLVYPAPRPDKQTIAKALKEGHTVPGCQLSNGGTTLVVKV